MKLIVLARSSHAGGGARWTEMFARGMNARGHDCRVAFTRIGNRSCMFHRRLSDIIIESICYRYHDRNHVSNLSTIIDTFQPDRIIVDNPERLVEASAFSSWLGSGVCKVVFLCHTHVTPPDYIRAVGDLLWKVVCVSNAAAELLPGMGATVIHNAAPQPDPPREKVWASAGIPTRGFVVGYVGRHDANKNTQIIYDACDGTDWFPLIGGPGTGTQHDPSEVWNVSDWYRAMDVFVLPSKTEGFPLSPMEALLCGTRVAMTPTSDYPTEFDGAVSFFEYGDVEGLRAAIRSAPPPYIGQEIIAQKFTLDIMLDKWEETLRA